MVRTSRDRSGRGVLDPLREFLHAETAGGIALGLAAIAALVWANSAAAGGYGALWSHELTIGVAPASLTEDLRHWVDDGLMAIFFFVVGLEIKRELVTGELREPRAALLPVLAAAGGVALPALVGARVPVGAKLFLLTEQPSADGAATTPTRHPWLCQLRLGGELQTTGKQHLPGPTGPVDRPVGGSAERPQPSGDHPNG
jgi:hypothetical protein